MTGTTTQACAACKFQRRKCSPECPLAPYFPPDQPKQFLNVHKLYGVSNTLRILKQVDPSKRNDAMKSILYEADARDRDPVHGCFGIITLLQSQAEMLREELEYVRAQIHILEQHQALAYYSHHHQQQQALLSYSNHLESMTTSSGDSYHCNTPTGCISNQNWQNQSLPSSSCTSPTTPTPTPNWIYQYMATATSQMQAALDSSVSPIGTRGSCQNHRLKSGQALILGHLPTMTPLHNIPIMIRLTKPRHMSQVPNHL